ncbi:Methionine--tRNA ligase [subsurface metagenome]
MQRVLTFVYRRFDGSVPTPGEVDSRSQGLLERAEEMLGIMDGLLYCCRFKEAIKSAMSLAQETNRYLEDKSPWKMIKQDRQEAATALYIALCVISYLKTMLYPFLPFSSEKLHRLLGFDGNMEDCGWQPMAPKPGQKLLPPEPLFVKLDEGLVAEETARLGH